MREEKMISFISELENDKKRQEERNRVFESTEYKFSRIEDEKDKARELCLDTLISKVYKNSIPMDNIDAAGDDLDNEILDFIKTRTPEKTTTYYVKEAIKKGSKPAKLLFESVNRMLHEYFLEIAKNIEDTPVDDIKFDIEDPETERKLEEISANMQFDELSDAINNNVKVAVNDEIKRVRDEKQKIKDLEDALKSDENVTSESAINTSLIVNGVNTVGGNVYTPTLVEGIMINKLNLIKESGVEIDDETANKLAFVETVKEYTKLSLVKALMLESFEKKDVDLMARRYATMKEKSEISTITEKELEFYELCNMNEGANLESRKLYKEWQAEFHQAFKDSRTFLKNKEYDKAKSALKNAQGKIDNVIREIDKTESDGGSYVLGSLAAFIPNIGRLILSFVPVIGYITTADLLIKRINLILKDAKKPSDVKFEHFNAYKENLKVNLGDYKKTIDVLIEGIDKKKEKNK